MIERAACFHWTRWLVLPRTPDCKLGAVAIFCKQIRRVRALWRLACEIGNPIPPATQANNYRTARLVNGSVQFRIRTFNRAIVVVARRINAIQQNCRTSKKLFKEERKKKAIPVGIFGLSFFFVEILRAKWSSDFRQRFVIVGSKWTKNFSSDFPEKRNSDFEILRIAIIVTRVISHLFVTLYYLNGARVQLQRNEPFGATFLSKVVSPEGSKLVRVACVGMAAESIESVGVETSPSARALVWV